MLTIQPNDYVIVPDEALDAMITVFCGDTRLGLFVEIEEALACVAMHTGGEKWPRTWWLEDHATAWLIDCAGNELF